jgi:tRNA 2-thiocytidine biosynthesis protein TtcA
MFVFVAEYVSLEVMRTDSNTGKRADTIADANTGMGAGLNKNRRACLAADSRSFRRLLVTPVLRAIKRYGMIDKSETIAVALSGGKDSTLLFHVLDEIRRYSSLSFEMVGIHVKVFEENDTKSLGEFCAETGVRYIEITLGTSALENFRKCEEARAAGRAVCSICARLKKGAMAARLEKEGIRRVALGHHATDVAETLLMNMIENRKLGSMSPVVSVEGRRIEFIRPMIYIDGRIVEKLHRKLALPEFDMPCPFEKLNRREKYRSLLPQIESSLGIRGLPSLAVASLENVDLSNLWPQEPKSS